ncbi:c-type cytochrome [Cardiobacterium sp. AH-315-I02]|nr:c-type cytochrome [Cardiobacterium sp. AH-315-I02]
MIKCKKKQVKLLYAIPLASILLLPIQVQAGSVLRGDIENGRALATEQCDRCHGDAGVSKDIDTPSLASQNAVYHHKQLRDYKFKRREDKNMYKRARKLSNQQMIDISIWYESRDTPPVDITITEAISVPQLVTRGDPRRRIPPCGTCHGGKLGENVIGLNPKLIGKSIDYLISTLEYFRDGTRSNDIGAVMRKIAGKLSDDEINMLATYYAVVGNGPIELDE